MIKVGLVRLRKIAMRKIELDDAELWFSAVDRTRWIQGIWTGEGGAVEGVAELLLKSRAVAYDC